VGDESATRIVMLKSASPDWNPNKATGGRAVPKDK